ncbi:ADAMTS-like protein 3 [Erythrolamprus reginae]|uniref:ADAMTS-like protein 3 n=1 Tax=Erythrolamprus reginae TaxID=121349 RepID=UPI00396C7D97
MRDVKCRIYLAFTQAEVELPDDECEGPKPSTERSCHLEPCDADPVPYTFPPPPSEDAGHVFYDWEYIGFTPCSATCLGGTQEAIAVCLHEETKQTVNDSLCDHSKRPPPMSRVCNTRLCPPRWQVGPWRQCTATCGIGIQTREVHCQQPGGSVDGLESCKDPKPHSLQVCNQLDCPPLWHVEEWQQCSRTCGGGTQNRKVTCQQLLMDGSFLKLSPEKCPEPTLPSSRACAETRLPSSAVGGDPGLSWHPSIHILPSAVLCKLWGWRAEKESHLPKAHGQRPTSGIKWDSVQRLPSIPACQALPQECLQRSETEAPAILASEKNMANFQLQNLSVSVGGTILARTGTNILLECPVKGNPQPEVLWFKNESSSRSSALPIANSSFLFLGNVSGKDTGIYTCTATNAVGHTTAATVLQLAGPRKPPNGSSTDSKRKRVFMASGIGTNITVAAGDTLRIGCPVYPSANNTIRWFARNQPIEEASGFRHKILVRGRILEFIVASDQFAGQYKCWVSSHVKPLSVWVNVKKEEYRWKLVEPSPCSTTICGNLGTRFRKFLCVNMKDQIVNASLCEDHPKLVVNNPQPCKIQDCPARWATSAWSECSASCGHGFHRRRITCKQLKSNRRVLTLPPGACADHERPLEMKPCVGRFCAEWMVHPWGQCTGRCINLGVGLQHRRIQCRHQNGSAVLASLCDHEKRPSIRRNCSSESCDVHWRTGPWRPCPVDCGSGFQSRQVSCVHRKKKRLVADQFCAWRKRPTTWKPCNLASCDSM